MHGVDLLLLTNSHLVLLGKGCLSFLDLIGFLEVFHFFLSQQVEFLVLHVLILTEDFHNLEFLIYTKKNTKMVRT